MKLPSNRAAAQWATAVLCLPLAALAALTAEHWQHQQTFDISKPGLYRFGLPQSTLDLSRPGLEDLRLLDPSGTEVPFVIQRPRPGGRPAQPPRAFTSSLENNSTVVTIETGLSVPIEAVSLATPAVTFIKAVQVEGSTDRNHWETLVTGQPIFRQPGGASQLRVAFPPTAWPWLRLRIDDRRSQPIPFTGATIIGADRPAPPTDPVEVTIAERHENPGVTRLTLKLPAANLDLATLVVQASDPLFTRQATLAVPKMTETGVREDTVVQATLFRIRVEGEPPAENLKFPVEETIRSRELVLLVRNLDSPPLRITGIRAERYPVYLAFYAANPGAYRLLTGNPRTEPPRYDLASLGADLNQTEPVAPTFSPPQPNPAFRPAEVLPDIRDGATDIDLGKWKYRKPIAISHAGVHQLDLDLDVMAHSRNGLADLRLARSGRQIPFILERTSISKPLTPRFATVKDPRQPGLSCWSLRFSHPNLPLSTLRFESRTTLFERDLALYENRADDRGASYRVDLARLTWVRTPQSRPEFTFSLDGSPRQPVLFLETQNRDNPPIDLAGFHADYHVTRILFKSANTNDLFLYYGNPDAPAPRYDLSLVAGQLLAADKTQAASGAEQVLKKSTWAENRVPGKGGVLFWSILALVVIGLLVILARLIPESKRDHP